MYEVREFLGNYYVVLTYDVGYEEHGLRVVAHCTRNDDAKAIVAALQQAESGGSAATNSAMDAIALAEKYHRLLPLGESELRRVTIQQFMVWLREQQHQ